MGIAHKETVHWATPTSQPLAVTSRSCRLCSKPQSWVTGSEPLVGTIITKDDGTVIATGHHCGAGTFHAERDAITAAYEAGSSDLSSTTLYTTLEPYRHAGRQPACTELIEASGITKIICATGDPTANGGGAQLLRDSGAEVGVGVLEAEADQLNHRWTLAKQQGRPFVTVHIAQTLDAQIAAADGTSRWIVPYG